MSKLKIRPALIQRVLPAYRAPFFEMLSQQFEEGLSLFAGQPRPEEHISTTRQIETVDLTQADNRHLFNGKFYLCWQKGLLEWLEETDPQVLVLEGNPRYLHSPAAVRWMHKRNRPVIGWGLGAGSGLDWAGWLRKRFIFQFDALLTYSQQGASQYAQMGFPRGKIFVAKNSVAPRPDQAMPQRPETLASRKPILLFVGRLQERKRIDLLIRACSQQPEPQRPDLWIVGDGVILDELQNFALENYPDTRFFGEKTGAELGELFKQADLFVLPGTGGLAIQQAMSFGLPVIAAEADGTQNDLVTPQNGWQVRPGELEQLSSTISQALQDIPRLRRMGQRSWDIVNQEINLEKMVEVFRDAIMKTMEEHK